jgi:hypothetical protein
MRRTLNVICCLLIFLAHTGAAESVSEKINQLALAFEQKQDISFKPVAATLDRWRTTQLQTAIKDLSLLFIKADPVDKPYVGYHLLSVSPRHRAARAYYVEHGLTAPFSEKGEPIPDAHIPVSRNRSLVVQVANLRYPPFSAVSEVVTPKSPAVQSYWKNQRSELDKLRENLVTLAQHDSAAQAYQVLAYYWPGAKEVVSYYASQNKAIPRQRTWFPSLDRYLLDHGLAGIDCLDLRLFKPSAGPAPSGSDPKNGLLLSGTTTWRFTEQLRNCRVESIFSANGDTNFSILDSAECGAQLTIKGKKIILNTVINGKASTLSGGECPDDISQLPFPVQMEVRGRKVSALVGGILLCSGDLPADYAYHKITVTTANMNAQQLRVRYLSELELTDDQLVATPPLITAKKISEAPWMSERHKQLDKTVTFRFADTSVEEVVTFLSNVSGVKISFDEKAETLKNLPVTMDAVDLKLSSALDWLKRVSDLSWQASEQGIQLTWSK